MCLCAIMPRGGCWAVDRPLTMLPFEIVRDEEREMMKGNRQSWREREEVSIFGSCGLPYLVVYADISKANTNTIRTLVETNHMPTIQFAEQHQKVCLPEK